MDLPSVYIFVLWIISVAMAQEEEDWTKNCNKCTCIWADGRRTANCANQNLSEIPKDLSNTIKYVDFSNNPIYSLGSYEFSNSNLRDIHFLTLQNCSIETISESAFYNLGVLIQLDMSRNRINVLGEDTFRQVKRLRILILSYNNISVLPDGLFFNMTFLKRIILDHNKIENISPETFKKLPVLNEINLGNNRLKRITFDVVKDLPYLNSLNVEDNPWICDCLLQDFRQSTIKNNLITKETECQEPPRLKGTRWQDPVIFACVPEILDPKPLTQVEATSTNVTLSCKVKGDPTPDVDWVNNGHIIERDPRKNKQKYVTFKNTSDGFTWNNLTITGVNYRDRGDYKCIAKNPGGEDERNITLIVPSGPLVGGGGATPMASSTLWIIGLAITFIVLLLVVLLLVCCFCKRSSHGMNAKRREHADSSEEYINMSGGQADIKKGLITDVNPVTKPPRATVPPSVVSGGTEVSDVKRNLLDNESVFGKSDFFVAVWFRSPLICAKIHIRVIHILLVRRK
ncbi:hypothetical protein NQ318_017676 [Aromia moschata]|uniref:Ig-like domain-containing protein n=1 Tax=Aromia moschata TaxID=1265417 RepID=A0AAV8X8R7_9CUCU|nr:hypothetical protein NQ318_017676 [Aromia moschata]